MNLENSKIFIKEVEPLKIHVNSRGIQNYCRNELIIFSQLKDGEVSVDILPCVDRIIIEERLPASHTYCKHEFEDIDGLNDFYTLKYIYPGNFTCLDNFIKFIKSQKDAINTYIRYADEYTKEELLRSLYVQLISKLFHSSRNYIERFYTTIKNDCNPEFYYDTFDESELKKILNWVEAFYGITFNS